MEMQDKGHGATIGNAVEHCICAVKDPKATRNATDSTGDFSDAVLVEGGSPHGNQDKKQAQRGKKVTKVSSEDKYRKRRYRVEVLFNRKRPQNGIRIIRRVTNKDVIEI